MARIDESFADATRNTLRVDDAINVLRQSVDAMGYRELAASIYHYPGRPQPAELWRRGIHIKTTHLPERPQFGKTDWMGGPGIALVDVNLCENGLSSYQVLFHECGHAIHLLSIRTKYESLRKSLPGFFMEGIAMFFDGTVFDPAWLQAHTALAASDRERLRRFSAMQRLFVLRENVAFALQNLLLRLIGDAAEYQPIEQILAARILYPDIPEAALGHMAYYIPRWLRNETSAEDIVRSIWLAAQLEVLTMETGDRAGARCSTACSAALSELLESVVWDESLQQLNHRIPVEAVGALWRDRIAQ
jgi:hypothetical protein